MLGLGLKFIPRPRRGTDPEDVNVPRFLKDLYTTVICAASDNETPRLYERSPNWNPDDTSVPREIAKRAHAFTRSARSLFRPFRCKTNLLPIQSAALRRLRNHPTLCVMKTDKNLGPAIIERHRYITKAYEDHLCDTKTYRQLDERNATNHIAAIKNILTSFITRHFRQGHPDRVFLERNLEKFTEGPANDPFARFYLTAKIHKTPWKSRPIISVSGSILHALGRYVDAELQIVVARLPYVVRSSADYAQELNKLGKLPPDSKLFTMDANAMYTNINTDHALRVIREFLYTSPLTQDLPVNKEAILDGLRILMRHNVFRLEDAYYVQMDGTAMGTPPACMYATLYYAIHEIKIIKKFPQLRLYGRYIDDGNGVWTPVPGRDNDADWTRFRTIVGQFGTLTWEFSELCNTLPFLDIQISIENGIITTRLYEKALNLYLYLPPSSTHSAGVTKGLVYGMVKRIYALTTHRNIAEQDIANLESRLVARGHSGIHIRRLIAAAKSPSAATTPHSQGNHVKLHLPYHPLDPHSSRLQERFRRFLSEPPGRQPLADIRNQDGIETGINRMIVCYSRHRNLAELLAPRKFKGIVKSAAETIRDLQTEADVNASNPEAPRGSHGDSQNSKTTRTTD